MSLAGKGAGGGGDSTALPGFLTQSAVRLPQARADGGAVDGTLGIAAATGIGAPPSGPISAGSGLPLPTVTAEPGTYYAAHWVDLARGGVPSQVRVEECGNVNSDECETFRERWSESQITGLSMSPSVAKFEGVSISLSFQRL